VSKEFAEVKSHHQEHTEIPHHLFVDKAENIGTRTLEMMKGENVLSFNFKKSNQAVTLAQGLCIS
jgi:hypothetical protein